MVDDINFLCTTVGKQEDVSSSLKLEQTLCFKWGYTDMLKLVSLLPGIHKLKYVGSILKQQN